MKKSFYFHDQAWAALRAIGSLRRASRNGTNVLHYALAVYRDLIEQRANGATFVVRNSAGKEWPFSPYHPLDYEAVGLKPPDIVEVTKKRRSFEFDDAGVAALASIRKRGRHRDDVEVLEAALCLYYDVLLLDAHGFAIVVRDAEGNRWRYDPHAPLERNPYVTEVV